MIKGEGGWCFKAEEVMAVGRVEGELCREVLKEFGIESMEDLYAKLGGLWTYITDWASLRLIDDPNSARRSVLPLWACVQGAGSLLGDPAALCRSTQSEATAPVSWYVPHILGCLVALAARLKLSELPDVLTALRQLAGEYLPEVTFTQRVQAEAIRLGLVQVAAAEVPPA